MQDREDEDARAVLRSEVLLSFLVRAPPLVAWVLMRRVFGCAIAGVQVQGHFIFQQVRLSGSVCAAHCFFLRVVPASLVVLAHTGWEEIALGCSGSL